MPTYQEIRGQGWGSIRFPRRAMATAQVKSELVVLHSACTQAQLVVRLRYGVYGSHRHPPA